MIIFLSFFILAYKAVINTTNIQNILDNSTRIPAFILIFSPYCPHCTKVHPDWLKLMDLYENDTKIVIAECNAISDGESCRKIFDYKGFPSFIAFTRRRGVWRRDITRTIDSFINETERLKTIDLSFPCPIFKTDFNDEYPAIAINIGQSKNESCSNLQRIEKLVPEKSSFLFVGEENESQIIAKLSKSHSIVYDGDNNYQSYADFINEYAIKQFEAHNTLIRYTTFNRKIVLLIYSQPGQFKKLQTLGEEYFKDFIFVTFYFKTFNRTYTRIQVTPFAAIVSNENKTKFAIFNNLLTDTNSTKQFLEKIKNNEYVADQQMPMLFPLHQNNSRRKVVNPVIKSPNKQTEVASKKEDKKQNETMKKEDKKQNESLKKANDENQAPPPGEAEIEKNESDKIKKKNNSKFVPIFLFIVGLLVMIAIGIFAYFKIKGKNEAKIE